MKPQFAKTQKQTKRTLRKTQTQDKLKNKQITDFLKQESALNDNRNFQESQTAKKKSSFSTEYLGSNTTKKKPQLFSINVDSLRCEEQQNFIEQDKEESANDSFSFQNHGYVMLEDKQAFLKPEPLELPNMDFISQTWIEQEQIYDPQNEVESLSDWLIEQMHNESFINPNYFDKQRNVKPYMRTMLLDWIIEVCCAMHFKRETFYLAVNYIDRYLTQVEQVEMNQLQLLGVTSLFISQKIEEIYPTKASEFRDTTDNAYEVQDILSMELDILRELKFMLTPNTIMFWANGYLKLWDQFISESGQEMSQLLFRDQNKESYYRYREFCQILDCSQLDSQSLQYNKRLMIISLIYLFIVKHEGLYNSDEIFKKISKNASILKQADQKVNVIFSHFIEKNLIQHNNNEKIQLLELVPYVEFMARFFALPLANELPLVLEKNPETMQDVIHYEELLNYQTHNKHNLQTIEFLNREFAQV